MERNDYIKEDQPINGRTDGIFYTRLEVGPRLHWQYVYYVWNETDWYRFEPGGWHNWYVGKAIEKLSTMSEQEQRLVNWNLVGRLAGVIRQRYQRAGWASQNSPIGGGKTVKGIEKWIADTGKAYYD